MFYPNLTQNVKLFFITASVVISEKLTLLVDYLERITKLKNIIKTVPKPNRLF